MLLRALLEVHDEARGLADRCCYHHSDYCPKEVAQSSSNCTLFLTIFRNLSSVLPSTATKPVGVHLLNCRAPEGFQQRHGSCLGNELTESLLVLTFPLLFYTCKEQSRDKNNSQDQGLKNLLEKDWDFLV